MAKRLWFPLDTAAPVTPSVAPDAAWKNSGQVLYRKFADTKGSSTITVGSTITMAAGSTPRNVVNRVYVSDTLDVDQTIAGTLTGQLMVREYATTDDVDRIFLKLYVVNGAGTSIRGTLLALGSYGPTAEFINNATHRNKTFADGDALTSVNALAGDRIVAEIGYSEAAGGGSSPEASAKWGENATDLPVNETQTTDGAGWIEFSQDVTFGAAGGSQTVTLPLIDQTAVATAPSLALTIVLALITQTAVASAPTLINRQIIEPPLINQTAVATAPSLGLTLALPLIDQTAVATAPTLINRQIITLPLIDQTAVATAPSLHLSTALPLINQTAVVFAPVLSLASGPQTIDLPLIDQTATVAAPSFRLTLVLPLIDQTAVTNAPTLINRQVITLALIDQTAVANAPTVSVGAGSQTITLPLIDRTATVAAPTLLSTIGLGVIDQTAVAHAPVLVNRQVIALQVINQTAVVYAPVLGDVSTWVYNGSIGEASSTSSGTTLVMTTTAAVDVGHYISIVIGADNVGTTDAISSEVASVTDSAGNTYVKMDEYRNGEGAAGAGALVSVWGSILSTGLPSGGTVTVTFSGAIVAKAMLAYDYTIRAFSQVTIMAHAERADDQTDRGSLTLSGLALGSYLFLRATAAEQLHPSDWNQTDDYTDLGTAVADTGTPVGSMAIRAEHRIFEATGDTSDPRIQSGTPDIASVYIALREQKPTAGLSLIDQTAVVYAPRLFVPAPERVRIRRAASVPKHYWRLDGYPISASEETEPNSSINLGHDQVRLRAAASDLRSVPTTVGQGARVTCYNDQGFCVWEGRLSGQPKPMDDGTVSLAAQGQGHAADKNGKRLAIRLQDPGVWQDASAAPYNWPSLTDNRAPGVALVVFGQELGLSPVDWPDTIQMDPGSIVDEDTNVAVVVWSPGTVFRRVQYRSQFALNVYSAEGPDIWGTARLEAHTNPGEGNTQRDILLERPGDAVVIEAVDEFFNNDLKILVRPLLYGDTAVDQLFTEDIAGVIAERLGWDVSGLGIPGIAPYDHFDRAGGAAEGLGATTDAEGLYWRVLEDRGDGPVLEVSAPHKTWEVSARTGATWQLDELEQFTKVFAQYLTGSKRLGYIAQSSHRQSEFAFEEVQRLEVETRVNSRMDNELTLNISGTQFSDEHAALQAWRALMNALRPRFRGWIKAWDIREAGTGRFAPDEPMPGDLIRITDHSPFGSLTLPFADVSKGVLKTFGIEAPTLPIGALSTDSAQEWDPGTGAGRQRFTGVVIPGSGDTALPPGAPGTPDKPGSGPVRSPFPRWPGPYR